MWAAKNELIDRDVALKIMRPDVAEDAVALQRFFNEAKASGRVRSSSIVEILDLDLDHASGSSRSAGERRLAVSAS